jgi:hypothetical protein
MDWSELDYLMNPKIFSALIIQFAFIRDLFFNDLPT